MGCYDSKPEAKSRCGKRGRRPVTFSGLCKGGGVPVPAAVGVTRSESVIDERVRSGKVRPRGASPPTPVSPSMIGASNIIFSTTSPVCRKYTNDTVACSYTTNEPISFMENQTESDCLTLRARNASSVIDHASHRASLLNPLPTTLLVVYEGVNKNSSVWIQDGNSNKENIHLCSTLAQSTAAGAKASGDAMAGTGNAKTQSVRSSISSSSSDGTELILMCVDCGVEINEDSENGVCMLTGKLHG